MRLQQKQMQVRTGYKTQMDSVRVMRFGIYNIGLTFVEDTMDSKNIRLTNFVYQGTFACGLATLIQHLAWLTVEQPSGGDDCIAIKPRSSNIFVQNATCRGGNGMAIGSLGQYLEDNTVENVVVDDVKVSRCRSIRTNE